MGSSKRGCLKLKVLPKRRGSLETERFIGSFRGQNHIFGFPSSVSNTLTIILTVDLTCYNQVYRKNGHKTKMNALFDSFAFVGGYVRIARVSIILIFTHMDDFAQMLETSPLEVFFPDYDGGRDPAKAIDYIRSRFMWWDSRIPCHVYFHLYDIATESSFSTSTLSAIWDDILLVSRESEGNGG